MWSQHSSKTFVSVAHQSKWEQQISISGNISTSSAKLLNKTGNLQVPPVGTVQPLPRSCWDLVAAVEVQRLQSRRLAQALQQCISFVRLQVSSSDNFEMPWSGHRHLGGNFSVFLVFWSNSCADGNPICQCQWEGWCIKTQLAFFCCAIQPVSLLAAFLSLSCRVDSSALLPETAATKVVYWGQGLGFHFPTSLESLRRRFSPYSHQNRQP